MMDTEGLKSLDAEGHRIKFFVAEVTGYWRKHRDWTQIVLILLFLILPWTTFNGQQTLFLNLFKREFVFFGLTFFAHDAPLIFFILATLTIGLTFVTSVWGRIWCGWACPQTVFIDTIYRRIEKWTEGNHLQRRKLSQEDLSFSKVRKISLKWFLYFVVSALIAHSFLAYFVGAHELLAMMGHSPYDNWGYFIMVFAMTGILLFDFGWFREQFCIIMCPYGRFQSVLLDDSSLTIFYDAQRGEPRKGAPLAADQKNGDCVSCNRCVQVCPTRIDIRDGLQMECIACTACIDACDEIMTKVNKPTGLIRYSAQNGKPFKFLKPRTLIYLGLILICLAGLTWNISQRRGLNYSLLRAKESPYSFSKNQSGEDVVQNHFRLHINSQSVSPTSYQVDLQSDENIKLIIAQNPIQLKPFEHQTVHIFFQFPKAMNIIKQTATVRLQNANNPQEVYIVPVPLVGPNGQQ